MHQVRGTVNEFAVYSHYADEQAFFEGHVASPHYADWAKVQHDLTARPTVVMFLDAVPWESERTG